ncbi:serine/threonine-protein kinase [Symbioplanes lichenis]|uniref:serine/threonine-protein kinase n=1 Tax=Symbioplanes lichenis TaxID=1629072 RepID=UPI002739C620|nr:serine/threonine-protein kinase [Actinoplanes lichenis]
MKDRYRLIGRLGVGGSSVVWRAHDEVLRRDVAVKVPSLAAGRRPALLDRIRQEARSAAALRHPNIVDVYDYDEECDEYGAPVPYVVMELVEGRTLAEVLAGGPLPWQTAVRICAQVASALAAAHEHGIVHRDVKPGNIMVPGAAGSSEGAGVAAQASGGAAGAAAWSRIWGAAGGGVRARMRGGAAGHPGAARGSAVGGAGAASGGAGAASGGAGGAAGGASAGVGAASGGAAGGAAGAGAARGGAAVFGDGVKLVDFGISAAAGSVDEIDGEVLGTPAYLAPERLDGGPVRTASDVYGLGLLLYRALAGAMPWEASTITEMVSAHLREEPRPLPSLPGMPRAVADLVRRCLAKAPEARPDAAEAAWILADAAGMLPRRALHFPKPVSGLELRRRRPLTVGGGRSAAASGAGRQASGGSVRGAGAAGAAGPGRRQGGLSERRGGLFARREGLSEGRGQLSARREGLSEGPGWLSRRRGGSAAGGVRRSMSTTVAALALGALLLLRAPSES